MGTSLARLGFVVLASFQMSSAAADLSIEEAVVQQHLADPEIYKVAYAGAIEHAYDRHIQFIGLDNPVRAAEMKKEVREKVDRWLHGSMINGTYMDTGMRDLGKLIHQGIKVRTGVDLPTNTIEKYYRDTLTSWETKGKVPEMDPVAARGEVARVMRWAQDPSNPNYERARELLRTTKINPDVPFVFTNEWSNHTDRIEARQARANVDQKLTDIHKGNKKNEEKLEELKGVTGELLDEVSGLSKALEDPQLTDDQAAGLRNQRVAQELGKSLGTAAALAEYLKAPDVAEAFTKMQGLTSGYQAYFKLVADGETFSSAPYAYFNVYAAIAVAAVNILTSSEKNAALKAQFKMLAAIMRSIDQLRQEMHARFSRLEGILYQSSTISLEKLKMVESNLDDVRKQLSRMKRLIENNHSEVMSGFRDIWLRDFTRIQTKCMKMVSGAPAVIREEVADDCRIELAQLMLSSSLARGFEDKSSTQTAVAELTSLKKLLSFNPQVSSRLSFDTHPATWIFGANQFLQFYALHPQFRDRANSVSIPGREDLSLVNLRSTGEQIRDGLELLALEPRGNEAYDLRTDLFNSLVDRYEKETIQAIDDGEVHVLNTLNGGPNPFLGLSSSFNDPNFFYQQLEQMNVNFCEKNQQIETANVNINPMFTRGSGFRPAIWSDIMNKFILRFDPASMKASVGFIQKIPAPVLWGLKMGNLSNLSLCFRQIKIYDVQIGYPNPNYQIATGFKFTLHMRIEVHVQKKNVAGIAVPMKVSTLVHDFSVDLPGYQVGPGAGCTPAIVHNAWRGQEYTCGNYTFSWTGVRQKPENLQVVQETPDPEYTRFVESMQREIERRKNNVEESFKSRAADDFSAARALRLVTALGLDPTNPAVRDFASWLSFPTALPDPAQYGLLAMKGVKRDALVTELKKRVEKAKGEITKLATTKDLRPRTSSLNRALEEIGQLQTPQSKSWWQRIWSWGK